MLQLFIPQIHLSCQFFTWVWTGEWFWTLLLIIFKNYMVNNYIKTMIMDSVVLLMPQVSSGLTFLMWIISLQLWQNKVNQWDLLFLYNIWLRVSLSSPCFAAELFPWNSSYLWHLCTIKQWKTSHSSGSKSWSAFCQCILLMLQGPLIH